MTTKEVIKWGDGQWRANLKFASPSKGGAVGVMFCWCRNPGSDGPDYNKASTADFVLKPISGSAAPAKFAEHFLGKTVGARGVNTEAVLKGTPAYRAVLDLLTRFKSSLAVAVQDEKSRINAPLGGRMGKIMAKQVADYDGRVSDRSVWGEESLNRWNQIWNHYATAEAFLVQETLQGIKEFGDVYREQHGLRKLLLDNNLMTNLGKLFAADAIIGNGDRLFKPNSGNIVFQPDGTLCSIDSATILTSYQEMLNDTTQQSWLFPGNSPSKQDWSNDIVRQGGVAVPTSAQQNAFNNNAKISVLPPGFAMNMLFDVDKWWRQVFRDHLEDGLRKESQKQQANGRPPLPPPIETDWSTALANFKIGVDEGIKKIDSQLSGLNWMGVKGKYKGFVAKYGGDPNLDWTNFKIRRLYFKARKRGKTDDQAMAMVDDYVKKKYPGI